MKFLDVQCPTCGAKAGYNCENLVKFRNRETGETKFGEMKFEYRVCETHKARKNAMAMELMRQQGAKLLGHVASASVVKDVPVRRGRQMV